MKIQQNSRIFQHSNSTRIQQGLRAQQKYTSGQITIRNSDGTETRGILTGYVDEDGKHEYYVEGDLQHLHYATDTELDNMLSDYKPDVAEESPELGGSEGGDAEERELLGSEAEVGSMSDSQGNPVNADGTLKLEKLRSMDELTEEDFTKPKRNVQLPELPENVDAVIGAEGKPVVIKKNIFEKNLASHEFSF